MTQVLSNFQHPSYGLLKKLTAFWQGRSMLWQLFAVSAVIQCFAAVIVGAIIAYNVRKDAINEMAQSMAAAQRVLEREIEHFSRSAGPNTSIGNFALDFNMPRRVDIELYDAEGQLVKREQWADPSDVDASNIEPSKVPQWFTALLAPSNTRHLLPVEIGGKRRGNVLLVAQTSDDIEDLWDGFLEFAFLAVGINLLLIFSLFLGLARVVSPLRMLVEGLRDLERGQYSVRLPRPKVFELAAITDRVNALSDHLRNAHIENVSLSRQLVNIQDDERRQIAAELHDELGPHLFGLSANISSLRQITGGSDGDNQVVEDGIERLLDTVNRIKHLNRQLLGKLRPMSIGRVSLSEALAGLLAELETLRGEVVIVLNGAGLAASYGETVDLTVYSCIREGVVNAIRHARAKEIGISIFENWSSVHGGKTRSLTLTIEDDGQGISPTVILGYGLTGIRERVRALGGEMIIAQGQTGGTKLTMRIPIDEQLSQ